MRFSVEQYDPSMHGWVGFDLDGTIARDEPGAAHGYGIGEPIPEMITLIKAYLAKGADVRIVTARAGDRTAIPFIQQYTVAHIGQALEITDKKDYQMWCLYDDRAVSVERNTGKILVQNYVE